MTRPAGVTCGHRPGAARRRRSAGSSFDRRIGDHRVDDPAGPRGRPPVHRSGTGTQDRPAPRTAADQPSTVAPNPQNASGDARPARSATSYPSGSSVRTRATFAGSTASPTRGTANPRRASSAGRTPRTAPARRQPRTRARRLDTTACRLLIGVAAEADERAPGGSQRDGHDARRVRPLRRAVRRVPWSATSLGPSLRGSLGF